MPCANTHDMAGPDTLVQLEDLLTCLWSVNWIALSDDCPACLVDKAEPRLSQYSVEASHGSHHKRLEERQQNARPWGMSISMAPELQKVNLECRCSTVVTGCRPRTTLKK